MLYATPTLTAQDELVVAELSAMRETLALHLRTPRRWMGSLRRTAVARAVRGSNSIEGYVVELDDADAAGQGDEPISADDRTFREIVGYRLALGYVLATADDSSLAADASTIRALHFMTLSHALDKSPGRYRRGEIRVDDERTGRTVYIGPDADDVPQLMSTLADTLARDTSSDPFVRAAMAHLNLVMIHPFRDGNGRMARVLHTLVLTRSGHSAPELSSIEEWLGAHTDDYYQALALTSDGTWSPRTDAGLWVSFCLRAHHIQAQTVMDRLARAEVVWGMLDDLAAAHRLPERTLDLLYSAVVGMRVRRAPYVHETGVDERTASRDFRLLSDAGLLVPRGETRGRHYVAGPGLADAVAVRRRSAETVEPYPGFGARLRPDD